MAGLSPPPRYRRSKQNSPTPSPLQLTSHKLTPRLPPIATEWSNVKSPRPPPPSPAPWSWYHRNCQHGPRPQQVLLGRPRQNPDDKSRTKKRPVAPAADYQDEDIWSYLDDHPDFLAEYVAFEVPARHLEEWLTLKRRMDGTSPECASSDVVTSCASSSKMQTYSSYNPRGLESRTPSDEEHVPSIILHPANPEKHIQRQTAVVLNGKHAEVKCLPSRPTCDETSFKRSPGYIDFKMMSPSKSKPTKPVPVHGRNRITQLQLPKQIYWESKNYTSLANLSNGLLKVDGLCDRPPHRHSNGLHLNGSHQPVSFKEQPVDSNGHQRLTDRDYRHQSSGRGLRYLNGHRQIESANGAARKTRRVLPDGRETPERRRACVPSSRCFTPRQLYLIKPVTLDDKKKNILSFVENLVMKVFPDAATELYLGTQPDLYIVTQTGLEHTSEQHSRLARRVILGGVPLFLNRRDLTRISDLPKHIIHLLRKNHQAAFVPFKFKFGVVVLEVWNTTEFSGREKSLIHSLPTLVSIILPYHSQYHSLLQESKMSDFLLQVAQAVFEEMLSLDQLIKKILEVAQHLVSADRASLFLVDHRNMELVSTVFDLRYETDQDSDFSKKEIRMPINKGIAGHVATSGEAMNIPDAYLDQRFNKAVDEATGYRTISILCMPIKVRGKILAVVQMVNKRDKKVFGADDESAFQVFSTFFGLALHHAKLYDKIKRKEQKYKVALEVLGYHNTCSEEEVETILKERMKRGTINYNDFALNPFEVNDIEKCKGILNMFEDLFDITKFDVTVLTRFSLTVKKNYRKVPYHNFDHGWAVANSMYVMLKHDTENRFNFNNRLALFVASLCHDLDHRGYTNKFMSEIASPLAAIYTTSTLEHHHFNMTVTILQQDGHNIFYQMSSEEYKDILDSIRQCILATDLAAFFPNLKKINELILETPQFDWNDESHRCHCAHLLYPHPQHSTHHPDICGFYMRRRCASEIALCMCMALSRLNTVAACSCSAIASVIALGVLGQSFCMTGADLSASAKPFDTQIRTVEIIFDEFYQQGDLERQAGRLPVAMMDRSRQDQLPSCQVGFLSQICIPCYSILATLFPHTKPMMDMATANLEIWKAKAKEIENSKEK